MSTKDMRDKESQLMAKLLTSGTVNDKLNAAVYFIDVSAL